VKPNGGEPAGDILTAEVGEEPEEKRQSEAEEEAGDDGEIKSGVFAAVDDVAGKAAESERKAAAEVEQGAGDGKDDAEDEQDAAEFAERVHEGIVAGRDEVKKHGSKGES
jgi:hypothetical protein